ncbi:potassium transporter TrkA, partial [Arthrobacter deserti]|nr:potassium transporter TrkA [Arthrobacter deserti]
TVVAILRDDAPITPSPDDVIEARDELFFITTIPAEEELRLVLAPRTRNGAGAPAAGGSAAGGARD